MYQSLEDLVGQNISFQEVSRHVVSLSQWLCCQAHRRLLSRVLTAVVLIAVVSIILFAGDWWCLGGV
jgi:hypothetical protein